MLAGSQSLESLTHLKIKSTAAAAKQGDFVGFAAETVAKFWSKLQGEESCPRVLLMQVTVSFATFPSFDRCPTRITAYI